MISTLLETVDAALEGRTPRVSPAPPWLAWLVVVVLRQRERQAWHRFIVNTRLREAEETRGDGAVPGLPGFTYNFHGKGCCLTGPDGEAIDVDRNDDSATLIDPYFFARRVETVRALRFPEMRLWRWMPSHEFIVASLAELRAAGALVYPRGDHLFHLEPSLEERVGDVRACAFDDATTQARWQSAFGDADEPETLAAHREWVRTRAMDPDHAHRVLASARSILGADELLDVCLHHLAGPVGPGMGKALETLATCAGDATRPVSALLERLSPRDDPPYPAYEALAYLLVRRVDDANVVRRFRAFSGVEKAAGFNGNPFLARYAILALRFLPALAMDLVRRALRSNTPICVTEMAALLAAIDQPWCVRELVSALEAVPGESSIAEALQRSSSELANRHAAKLYAPPSHDPSRPGYTWEEVHHNSAGGMLDNALEAARPLADELRLRYSATWEG